jgi:hypothetical protein
LKMWVIKRSVPLTSSYLFQIVYLRRFPNLKSLNMVGNPCAETEDFRLFIATFLPQLVYYEYRLIYEMERELGEETFR